MDATRTAFVTVFTVMVALGTGCATSGRYIPLKEYQSSVPPRNPSPLAGKTVHVKEFRYTRTPESTRPPGEPVEPPGFEYREMSDEQEDQWDEAYNAMKEGFQKSDANKVGHVRNGFGMAMSGVYVMNDPGAWIKETLEMEVAAQGGRVVASPAGADLVVGGTIPWLEVDMYMSYWADLIVDVELAPKGRPVVRRSFHTHGSKTAWSSSSFEYYQPVRMCEQKFMVLLIREMGDVVSR